MKPRAAWLALILGMSLLLPVYAASKADKDEKEDKADKKAAHVAPMSAPMSDEEKDVKVALIGKAKYKDLDTCVSCHDAENEYPVFPLFKTKHAVVADPRSPMANHQCESCHGAGTLHTKAKKADKRGGTIINFGKNAWTPVKDQNEKCLACHQTHQRIQWKGSTHAFNDVACSSCHTIHVAKDPVMDRLDQSKVCYGCHANKQAKFYQASHHPVREGKMTCSECHNVHGEDGSGLMVKSITRDKCTSCHAEKRGPFLWEHAPAAEDCNLCHDPHGSNHAALLKKRQPQLCQQCHSPAGHPSTSFNGSRPIDSVFLGGKSCANCHTSVHGSNHPSGVAPVR